MPESIEPVQDWAPAPVSHRTIPSTWGGVSYLAILAVTTVGLLIAANATQWRIGITIVGGGLLATAVLRMLVPERHAGMLAVRHWLLDAALLITIGIVLIVLAWTIPNQPTV